MIKAGIVGYGYMGHFHHEKILQFPNKIKLIAIFDTNPLALDNAKEKHLKVFDNIHDFLKEDLDLVIISTPNQWHAPYAKLSMLSGKNVLLEKPAVMNSQELEELIAIEKETQTLLTVHHQRRHDADFQVVSEIISKNEIGNITTIESRVMGERGVCFGWRANPEFGGGMLYDWGVHLIDQVLQLFINQRVKSIHGRLISVLTPAVDDFFEILMTFDNNITAKVMVTTFAMEKLPRWFVFGDRGTLKIDDFSGLVGGAKKIKTEIKGYESVVGKKNLGPSRTMAPLSPEYIEEIPLPIPQDKSLEYWNNLINSLENKKPAEVKSSEILRVMQIVDAAFESSAKNIMISVNI